MEVVKEKNKLIVPGERFDIRQTLDCGQVFRYRESADGAYVVYSKDKACYLRSAGGRVTLETSDTDYFYKYFDLDTDYSKIIGELSCFTELSAAIKYGGGIRILRQDLLETIISFIISANNNIPRIKGIIERICESVGSNMGEYFAFPTITQLQTLTEADYKALGCGFRANYLYETVKMLADGTFLAQLVTLDSREAAIKLCSLKGVGAKVADCVSLFALAHTDSYPVDTWIFKANKIEALDTPQKVREYYSRRYGKNAGYAQQYIFYAGREKVTN